MNIYEFLKYFLPAIVTVIGNLLTYLIIKKRIDNSIEKYKITYSGVFKEKIDIHKEILKNIFSLKHKIHQFQYTGNEDLSKELFITFNQFINHYLINQPFIKKEIYENLEKITKELQECFEDINLYHSLRGNNGIEPKTRDEYTKKFIESGNKLKKNLPFKELEELIITEMKKDLNIT